MSPLLGYGAVMTGCVVLEQLQVWMEQMLSRRGGFRKFLRTHGVHIVLMFILLPIIGTFLAGISVFLGGLLSDIVNNAETLWTSPDDASRADNRPGATLSRFFGPSFGRDTYIKFKHSDIEQSFRDIDTNRNLVIAPSEFKTWLTIQRMQPMDGLAAGVGRGAAVADAMTHTAISTKACRHNNLKSVHSGLDYQCYCTIVVQAVEEYYGEAYDSERHAGCKSQQARGASSSKRNNANLGYTLSCKDEQEAKAIHDFLHDHSGLKHSGVSTGATLDLLNYPELTMIHEGSERWVGVRTSVDLKTELGDAGLDWRSVSGVAGLPWWAQGSTEKSPGGAKYAKPYIRFKSQAGDTYDDAVALRDLANFCANAAAKA
jgi:phage-related protein